MPDKKTGQYRPKVLIVEDEYFVADDLARGLADLGAHIVGFAPSLSRAVEIADRISHVDVAVLDVRLSDGQVFSLVDRLQQKGTCVVFYTASSRCDLPQAYRQHPLVEKPAGPEQVYAEVCKACE
jgi:CheY-like chemotaxis protein